MESEINTKSKKISFKKLFSFINRKVSKSPQNAVGMPIKSFMAKTMTGAERDLVFLIEAGKAASNQDDLVSADFFYELIELKEKELEVIYNYIKRD